MNVLDLFSGIGGCSLGLERAGMRTVAFCEADDFCRRVLAHHWPGVPIFGNIREFTKHRLIEVGVDVGAINLVCAGPPCQPVSFAGKRRGKDDDRWLWGEALRLVAEIRPRWCLFENPPGIITMGLDSILAELEGYGYETG